MINQAPWYIKQRVKTVAELARHSSENTLIYSIQMRSMRSKKAHFVPVFEEIMMLPFSSVVDGPV
eukprot:COSAG06_NODE_3594_length_5143_cov_2.285686_1_plen_65_part_00